MHIQVIQDTSRLTFKIQYVVYVTKKTNSQTSNLSYYDYNCVRTLRIANV